MGSTGTGRFSDYSGTPNGRNPNGGGTGGAGSPNEKNCETAIGDIEIEEVGRCPFFQKFKAVPKIKSLVSVKKELVGGRIAVQEEKSSFVIGYLPTRYNYLRVCMNEGFSYIGVIISVVEEKDFPRVWVDLAPQE